MNALGLVIEREYLERVKRKSFIWSTILVPVLMIGLMFAPALIIFMSDSEQKTIQVVDQTGLIAGRLKGNEEIRFLSSDLDVDSLRANEDNQTILVIGKDAIDDPSHGITLLTRNNLALMTDAYITGELNRAIEDVRMERYNISDLRQIMEEVKSDVHLTTIRIDKEKETETSSEFSYFLSLLLDMMLYMFILLYGQQVMTSIIEEKNNRVLEIVVSSVKPFQLMMGKLAGVGLVAVTQILIWAVLIGGASMFVAPLLTPENLGDAASPSMVGAISQFTDPGFLITIFVSAVFFFIGGFLFYASIYAAIGSAVSNIQDASQLSSVASVPIIIGIVSSMFILADPGSSLSFWISIIPFTSPMAMMARIPYGVAAWEIILSLVILYASFIFMIWLCAKIYRVGIFMYGKKPTLKDLLKWARYK